jgi:SepF-like predicted cell division protein (DUF552 family)
MEKKKKKVYQKVWFWILIVIVVGGIGSQLGNNDSEKSSVSTNDTSKKDETKKDDPTKEETKQVIKLNQVLKVGDVEFKVTNISSSKSVGEYIEEKAQGTFLIIDIAITNKKDKALDISSSWFKLINDKKEYEPNSAADLIGNNNSESLLMAKINPDSTIKAKIFFDVSDSVVQSNAKVLEVQTGFWGTEKGQISLVK